jgi:hypothetical protein
MVAHKQITGNSPSLYLIYPLIFLPYFLYWKAIRNNIVDKDRA